MPVRSTAKSLTISPPLKGWNTKDPLANMDPEYAIYLENFFPGLGQVELRNGNTSRNSVTNLGTLGTFKYNGLDKLIGCTTSFFKLYDIIPGTSATDITGAAAITNWFVYYQQFRDRVFMTTDLGQDDVYHWTGTGNIAASVFTGPGGDDKKLGPMAVYRNRLYFAHRNAYGGTPTVNYGGLLEIWYGGSDAITGALATYDLSSIFRLGGYIHFIGSVTRSKDYSEDELFCIVSSEGEILLYQGLYPNDTTWSLVGHYFIPRPFSGKSFFYFGSSLMIITVQGVYSLDAVMSGNFAQNGSPILSGAITDPIKKAFTDASAAATFSTYLAAWTGLHHPAGNYLIINVPNGDGSSTTDQFVMNTLTGAWCKFTGQLIYSMVTYKDKLYFTKFAGGALYEANSGTSDNGSAIVGKMKFAFNYLGDRRINKQFVEAQPIINQSQGLNLTLDINVDFEDNAITSNITDTSDVSYKAYRPRMGIKGVGKCVAIRIDQSFSGVRFDMQAIDVKWNEGDIV